MKYFHLAIGWLLRAMPSIRGRHRIQRWWLYRGYHGAPLLGKTPSGAKILCDLGIPFEAVVWLGREEWDDIRRLADLLKPGQHFVDVGANIGTWTMEAASLVGDSGSVNAFEPNPVTVRKLTANVNLNDMVSRIRVHASAVSSEPGIVTMSCPTEHNLAHVVPTGTADTVSIPSITLDDVFGAASTVNGMKIDVEGHELAVLTGARRLVERCRPWIIVEFNLDLTPAKSLGDWDVHRWFVQHGYAVSPMPSTSVPHVDAGYRPPVVRYANLLYRPAE